MIETAYFREAHTVQE